MSQDRKYDVKLEWGSSNLPLMLALDKDNSKKYISYYAPPIGDSLRTGEASSANFPPEQELTIEQSEFYAGMGLLNYSPKRYAFSNGVDARTRGAVRLSAKENSAAITLLTGLTSAAYSNLDFETWSDATTLGTWNKSSAYGTITTNREGTEKQGGTYACNFVPATLSPDIVDAGLETWTDASHLTNWTSDANGSTTTLTRESSEKVEGTYSAKLYASSAISNGLTQVIPWSNYYKGKAFTVKFRMKSNIMSHIQIYDGVGSTTAYHTGGNTWEELTVTRTLDANATSLTIFLQLDGAGTAYVDKTAATPFSPTQYVLDSYLYQDLSTFADCYENKATTFTCYCKTSLASNMRVGIYDGSTATYSDYHTGGGAYENLSVTHTPKAGADKIRITIDRNSDTYAATDYCDTATFTQSAASRGNPLAPQSFFKFLTDYYYIENKSIFKLSGTTFTEVYTFEDAITGAEIFGSYFIVSVGVSDFYYWSTDGSAWTRATTPAGYKMILLRSIGDTLYGTNLPYAWKTNATPTTGAAWSSDTDVGNQSTSITDIAEYNQTAFFGKEDNLYYIDTEGAMQSIAPDFKGLSSTNNCLGMKPWRGALWIPLNNGLYKYTFYNYSHSLENISPSAYMSYFSDYHGRVHAIAGDLDWLYVATSSSTSTSSKTPILACRKEDISGVEIESDIRFHSLRSVDLDDVIAMDIYSSKLWIAGKKSTTAYIRYFSLANDDYPTSGTDTITTCYFDSNFPSFYKSFHSFELQSNNLTTNIKIKVEFQIDGGTWTELSGTGLGTFTSSSVPQVKYFQANTYGRKIRFRFTLITNSATTSPEITGFIVRGALRPDTLRVQEWWVDATDHVAKRDGSPSDQTAANIITQLNTAKAQPWALTTYDPWGNSMSGFIKSPTPEITNYFMAQDNKIKTIIHLVLQEARLS